MITEDFPEYKCGLKMVEVTWYVVLVLIEQPQLMYNLKDIDWQSTAYLNHWHHRSWPMVIYRIRN